MFWGRFLVLFSLIVVVIYNEIIKNTNHIFNIFSSQTTWKTLQTIVNNSKINETRN